MGKMWQCDICRQLGDEGNMMVDDEDLYTHRSEHYAARRAYENNWKTGDVVVDKLESYRLPRHESVSDTV